VACGLLSAHVLITAASAWVSLLPRVLITAASAMGMGMNVALVALGAGIGSGLRYLAGRTLDRPAMHWGTLLVNITGSFILGMIAFTADSATLILLGAGFCGGLTTYSSFAVQAAGHEHRVNWAYIALTLTLCPAASAVGIWVTS